MTGALARVEDAAVAALTGLTTDAGAAVAWSPAARDAAPGERLIAPGGEGLWRRAPLPAADELFELAAPGAGTHVLVAGGPEERRAGLAEDLAARGVAATAAARLDRERLEGAAVVLMVADPRAPLPSLAPAVMAAGRILVAPRSRPSFGFQPGTDHLAYDDDSAAAAWADAAARAPEAFAAVTVLARVAAEAHRASRVLHRLATDLALEAAAPTAPPPPAAPPA